MPRVPTDLELANDVTASIARVVEACVVRPALWVASLLVSPRKTLRVLLRRDA